MENLFRQPGPALFVALPRALIVCEGPTDNIYLRNAIRCLTAYHPQLGSVTPDGFKYGLSFFNYTNQIHKILNITGGIGHLLTFIHGYKKQLKNYKFRPLAHPVIVLVDNDTVLGQKVCNALKKHFGVDVTHASPALFFHLTDNLYLVKTPLVGTLTMTCIEDLFDAATKAMPLDGKTFHTEKVGFDPTKHVGKAPFATKIISSNASAISWGGFVPLLDRIVAVLNDYSGKLAVPPAALPSAPHPVSKP